MILILSIALIITICILLLNSRYILNSSSKAFSAGLSFSKEDNDWFLQFIPGFLKNYIEVNVFYTNLEKKKVYKEIFFSTVVAAILLISYFYTFKFYLLILSLIVLFSTPLDFAFNINSDGRLI